MKINSSKKIGILGSGFALYGYFIALKEGKFSNTIYTLSKYKKFFIKRKDLSKYYNTIFFCKNERELIKKSDYIIFARRPKDQENFINKISVKKKTLFLEKPIASDPNKSFKLVKKLFKKNIKFKIGFLFYYLNWFKKIIKLKKKQIRIRWNFFSSDLKKNKNTWKINDKYPGGGLIAFYGIHFIFLITFFGKIKKIKSKLFYNRKKFPVKWNLTVLFVKRNYFILDISINKKQNLFTISTDDKKTLYKSTNPFGVSKYSDLRIKSLISHLKTSINLSKNYFNHINIWKTIIKVTEKRYEKNKKKM